MSIPVELRDLSAAVGRFGFAYLLTVSDDGRPHSVAVEPVDDGGTFVVDVGRRTRANATARPKVSLLYPPVEAGGYSLIVDAAATVEADVVRLTASSAVLHRPAAVGFVPQNSACTADCVPLRVDTP